MGLFRRMKMLDEERSDIPDQLQLVASIRTVEVI